MNVFSKSNLFARNNIFLNCRDPPNPCPNGKRPITDLFELKQAIIDYQNDPSEPEPNCWDISAVTDLDQLFRGMESFNEPIGNWDTSAVTRMTHVFSGADNLPSNHYGRNRLGHVGRHEHVPNVPRCAVLQQNIGKWDTTAVINMRNTFDRATVFNQNIATWDTSKVTSMAFMFRETAVFNQDLSNWDTSAVTSMESMFQDVAEFNQDLFCCRRFTFGNVRA